jgi:hypothetical protein
MISKQLGWDLFQPHPNNPNTDPHQIPTEDIREHIMSPDCPCQPEEVHAGDTSHPLTTIIGWIHNSFDGREDYDNRRRKLN